MWLPEEQRLPRDAAALGREVDALIKISDIRTIHHYRDQLESKWWEPAIVSLLFVSGLGFILTIYKMIPNQNQMLFWFVFGWFALFVLTLILTIEFLLLKIAALRKLHEIHTRIIDDLVKNSVQTSADNTAGESSAHSR